MKKRYKHWFLTLLASSIFLLLTIQTQAFQRLSFMVEMRDGARLATDVYLPEDYSKDKYKDGLPLVLVRTIYSKENKGDATNRWRDVFLKNGYAFAIQDVRGFYASETEVKAGSKAYDGYDTIEWLAQQAWSNGKVGMIGLSALGAAQYEAAVTNPPSLACAIPAQAPGNYYTDAYYPPTFRKADMETILRGAFSSVTKTLIDKRVRTHEVSRLDQFNIPMLHTSGWYDFYKEGAIEMFNALQENGGMGARGKQQLLIGPWGHGVAQEENPGKPLLLPGGLAYPVNSKLDWEKEVWLPWFDSCLKGVETGVMEKPPVKYYLMGDVEDPKAPGNEWVEADQFPPHSIVTPYYANVDRTLSPVVPGANGMSSSYRYDPRDPVPTVGRSNALVPVKGPYDQRAVEDRLDVLSFTTEELKEPLKIVGNIEAIVWAASDRLDTDFTVKLTDVYPDGRSMSIADGIVKGRYRNTFLKEELLVPGKVYEFRVDLGYMAIVIAPGHQLRLSISSSNFDRFDINPNTGEPYGPHALTMQLLNERFGVGSNQHAQAPAYTEALVATNTVYMDIDRPTKVLLPIVP